MAEDTGRKRPLICIGFALQQLENRYSLCWHGQYLEQRKVGAGDSAGAFGTALAADRGAGAITPRDGARELAVDRTVAALPA
jgi:hypothetical protein